MTAAEWEAFPIATLWPTSVCVEFLRTTNIYPTATRATIRSWRKQKLLKNLGNKRHHLYSKGALIRAVERGANDILSRTECGFMIVGKRIFTQAPESA